MKLSKRLSRFSRITMALRKGTNQTPNGRVTRARNRMDTDPVETPESPIRSTTPKPLDSPNKNPTNPKEARKSPKEDFGRDKDLRTLLKNLQPKAFSGEGKDVPKVLEEWIITMEDYFQLAEYNCTARSIMGQAKLEGTAKTWWKLSCKSRGVQENTQSWEEVRKRLRGRYLPLNYSTSKMNEFLACTRDGRQIEEYYEEFIKLSCHAPHLTEEQILSRFVWGLEGSLADEVDALRPSTLADALIRAKAKLSSLQSRNIIGEKRKLPTYSNPSSYRNS